MRGEQLKGEIGVKGLGEGMREKRVGEKKTRRKFTLICGRWEKMRW